MDTIDFDLVALVAERGSLSSAAEVLHMSQPSVSLRIARVETSLGARLFDRDSTGARLTEAGERYLPYIRRVLSLLAEAEATAAGAIKPIRIGVPASFAEALATGLADSAEDAGQTISIRVAHSDTLRAEILDGILDLGITIGDPTPAGLVKMTVGTTRLMAVSAPNTILTSRSRWAVHAWGPLTDEAVDIVRFHGTDPHRMTQVSPSGIALSLALERGFAAIVPDVTAHHLLRTGQLDELPRPPRALRLSIDLVHGPRPREEVSRFSEIAEHAVRETLTRE